jgi:hypothetical protein
MWYDLYMSSLTKKTFSGRTYYYLRDTARVEGKPKVVKTTYLGRAEDIEAALRGALRPSQVRSLAFGDVAAALAVLRTLGLREVIDRVAPKREQGLSVGSYLELVVINRATSPTSKSGLAGFHEETCLSRLLGHPARALAPQRLFDAMGALGEEQLVMVEEELVRRAREAYGLCAQTILFDTTCAWWVWLSFSPEQRRCPCFPPSTRGTFPIKRLSPGSLRASMPATVRSPTRRTGRPPSSSTRA